MRHLFIHSINQTNSYMMIQIYTHTPAYLDTIEAAYKLCLLRYNKKPVHNLTKFRWSS